MSVAFESPTRYLSDSSHYSLSDNESHCSSNNSTPLCNINNNNNTTNTSDFQEFMNVIQSRQYSSNLSTGWSFSHTAAAASAAAAAAATQLPHSLTSRRTKNEIAGTALDHQQQHNNMMEELESIDAKRLHELIIFSTQTESNNPIILIDVRSFACYQKKHIQSSINICIPSVLLKRPAYTLEKVCDTIGEKEHRKRLLQEWNQTSHIIFYDHSSYKPSDSGNSATAILLGSKLRKIGYQGQLNYLLGGFNVFSELYPNQCSSTVLLKSATGGSGMQGRLNKPMSIALPTSNPTTKASPAVNPFFSNIRQNLELSHGPLQERFDVRLPCGSVNGHGVILNSSQASSSSIHHPRFGLAGSSMDLHENFVLPSWLQEVTNPMDGSKKLAALYESLERTEQKRMATIMEYHTKNLAIKTLNNNNEQEEDFFPLSITSSMEKGALNRYDNIWPFEYSRVKKQTSDDDYINANYIQFAKLKTDFTVSPISRSEQELQLQQQGLLSQASVCTMNPHTRASELDSNRQYISTQGPLPTTFHDFWKMIWDEQSFVIVMLTQEVEMNKIKCHRYWPSDSTTPVTYGDFTISLLSESQHPISNMNDKRSNDDECIIVRKLRIVHNETRAQRQLTHLHYTGWTDFGVPDHPIGLLQLVYRADEASKYHALALKRDHNVIQQVGPMTVHCSAGCGRSGTFCVVDTTIQRLWNNRDVYTCFEGGDKIWETVKRFREQRMSMVQTHRQFVFCYEAVLWWLLGYGCLPANNVELSPTPQPLLASSIQTPQHQYVGKLLIDDSQKRTDATGIVDRFKSL